ncbi:DUF6391 domain-containing protein [Halarsenatibacter silvermanii]|uniref:Uncharacterized protein n=1 Tax=Halarsenatibacter silvermanii TaxID=321763 RepID=A0A1G9JK57_9FIRM|nr:DUF6391 domain-containing protein [Halarsenatibacter silvermanii]SDL37473.1 hypothetical protein SAMN04488692_1047 [Halarsenatibacter silvermanii]
MAFWLLFLLLIFFFPVLIGPFLLFFLFLLLLIPLKFTLTSLTSLFSVPGELYRIAKKPALRKNHALEHATINVLEELFPYEGLSGYAEEDGFYILGVEDISRVEKAAREGLKRLSRGEKELVIHDRCGTTITAANLASAVIFLIILFTTGFFSIWTMLLAMGLANLVGPFLGRFLQTYVTTSHQVESVEIVSARYEMPRSGLLQGGGKVYVETREVPFIESR